jgi:outer membrane protein assembly factor BamB
MLRHAFLLILTLAVIPSLQAGDWPQILGPHRNGIAADDEKLADRWPAGGLPVLWERPVGSGYAGIAVADGLAVLFHREREEEITEALDAATGETKWKGGHPTTFYPQVGGGDGPLCVPTIHDGKVITFGAQGVLSCFDLASGERLWMRETHREFRAQEGYFGAGSSPLVIGENVIVNVGGSRANAGIVAFSIKTGETAWTQTDEPASYSSPTLATVEGLPHVLIVTRYKCLLLDPASGAIRFQFPFGQRGPTVNAATPLVLEDHLLVTASYGIGTVYASFDLFGIKRIWEGDRQLATQYCTPIKLDGHLYVIDGRDDRPPADLKCLEVSTGNVLWTEPDFGYGTLLLAGGKLIVAKTNGELLLMRPSPDGPKRLSRARPFADTSGNQTTIRALPAISDGRLFLRDQETLKCLDLSPRIDQ